MIKRVHQEVGNGKLALLEGFNIGTFGEAHVALGQKFLEAPPGIDNRLNGFLKPPGIEIAQGNRRHERDDELLQEVE